jgi:hypothetical protein
MSNEFDVAKRAAESLNSAMAGGSYAPKEDKFDIDKMRAEMNSFKPLSEDAEEKEDDSVNEALVLRWLGVSVILDRTGWDLMKEAEAVGQDHVLDNIDPPPSDGLWICECFVEDAGASDWGGGARDVSIGGKWRPATKEEVESFKTEDNAWAHR